MQSMGYQSGFSHEKVWVLGMGDVCMMVPHLPANGIGRTENLWGIGSYWLGELWVKGDSTVHIIMATLGVPRSVDTN